MKNAGLWILGGLSAATAVGLYLYYRKNEAQKQEIARLTAEASKHAADMAAQAAAQASTPAATQPNATGSGGSGGSASLSPTINVNVTAPAPVVTAPAATAPKKIDSSALKRAAERARPGLRINYGPSTGGSTFPAGPTTTRNLRT